MGTSHVSNSSTLPSQTTVPYACTGTLLWILRKVLLLLAVSE